MEREIQYIVYTNLFNLLSYRGFTSLSNLSERPKFIESLTKNTFIEVKAERKKTGDKLSIFMFATDSRHLKGKTAVEKFINKHIVTDCILITETNQPHANIKALVISKPDVHVEVGVYDFLIFNFPTHVSFTKYERVTDEEEQKFKQLEHKKLTRLPRGYTSDMCIFWMGARPGDVIKCDRLSDTAGEGFYMRRVY